MKSGFASAMLALSAIQNDDKRLEATVDANRAAHERQLGDVLHMLIALKVGPVSAISNLSIYFAIAMLESAAARLPC